MPGGSDEHTPPRPAWRGDAEATWAFVERFFDALAASGVEAVCVSPGSRSTPLALAAHATAGLVTSIHLDERAAGFFALGRARATRRPVALVCTSGTAAANYLPAVVEAHHAGVPLLVCTADRPPELRGWGAGQTIDQLGLYGRAPKAFFEVPVPEPGADALRFAGALAARAVAAAWTAPRGPVHLNFPFREPLEPPLGHVRAPAPAREGDAAGQRGSAWFEPSARAPLPAEVERLVQHVRAHPRGLVCAGQLDQTADEAGAIADFAARAGWPILADPLSQLRCGAHVSAAPVVCHSEGLLRSAAFGAAARAAVVLRLGGAPVSKAQRLWLAAHPPERLWLVDEQARWEEPGHLATEHAPVSPGALLGAAAERLATDGFTRAGEGGHAWVEGWLSADREAARAVQTTRPGRGAGLLEADVVRVLAECSPEAAVVMLSNSMPIRDADAFWPASARPLRFVANRGANGIDGINSTALGLASAAHGAPVVALVGDLALLHDLSGLLAAREIGGSLTHVVLDNDGGGIFDFLPVAGRAPAADFERLFTTPHGRDLRALGDLFDVRFEPAPDEPALRKALASAIGRPGVTLVHVPIDRAANQAHFRSATAAVAAAADAAATRLAS